MPPQPPQPRAQTIKQAKASYKARGRPSISEADKKKLERAAELDRRAWRIQEAEKRKAELAKKRVEKEKKEREGHAKAPLGSQRRFDRFGYKSSQMHLGAFLRKPGPTAAEQKENVEFGVVDDEDEFGDLDMDDATLLQTLDGAAESRTNHIVAQIPNLSPFTTARTLLPLADSRHSRTPAEAVRLENLDDFFDELGSGTQIARELEAEQLTEPRSLPPRKLPALESDDMLNTDDFDLTEEDLEELAAIPIQQAAKQEDRILMPPPPVLGKKPMPPPPLPKKTSTPPPPLPKERSVPPPPLPRKKRTLTQPPINETEFTLGQLEQFIDDDLQLTQMAPD